MSNFGGAQWQFEPYRTSDIMQSGTTQKVHFEDEDILLVDSLVREVIQNSTDAIRVPRTPVTVRFDLTTLVAENEVETVQSVISGLGRHLRACDVEMPDATEGIRLLVIEDYNTCGLTGAVDRHDSDNFASFWRSVGVTEKKGVNGGRWGLGKIVFPASSRISTFFGVSWREGDDDPVLFGRSILRHHRIEEEDLDLTGYAFWFVERDAKGTQLPIRDNDVVVDFSDAFLVGRYKQPGLSIVIPFVKEEITEEALMKSVLTNYYFPILDGNLVVVIGNRTIDKNSFRGFAQAHCDNELPFDFVRSASKSMKKKSDKIEARTSLELSSLSAESFDPGILSTMRERSSRGRRSMPAAGA